MQPVFLFFRQTLVYEIAGSGEDAAENADHYGAPCITGIRSVVPGFVRAGGFAGVAHGFTPLRRPATQKLRTGLRFLRAAHAYVFRELARDLSDRQLSCRDDGSDVVTVAFIFGPTHVQASSGALAADVDVRMLGKP
jgi:hypothetical protein